MPFLPERLLCRGLFFVTAFLLFNASCAQKANRCVCDWGGVSPPGATKCFPLNTTGERGHALPKQQYCNLIHGVHDGFCLIEIVVNVKEKIWEIMPHCENIEEAGLVAHCPEDSPYSAFNIHDGPVHSFQYCCTSSDFCNNRSLPEIQRDMCSPDMVAKLKRWTGSSPTKIEEICAGLEPTADSPHVALILTIVVICVALIIISAFALFSWNRIVKYKLEYDRSCRQQEAEFQNRSLSSTPTSNSHPSMRGASSQHRRNGWLVALSSAFSRRRQTNGSLSVPMTNSIGLTSSHTAEMPIMLSGGRNGDSISYTNGTAPVEKPTKLSNGGPRRFPRLFGRPNVAIPPGGGRFSPTNPENSSTVQTGSSLLPPGTSSICNNRSQQMNNSQMNSEFSTSGSGSGRPLLGTRTIARQIQLGQLVGKGRYGEVYAGSWVNGRVAVKVFPSREHQSWEREIEIYNALTMRHKNILTFVAADSKDAGLTTELWLVTAFHPRGSLFDFLSSQIIPLRTALRLALGVASGVAHLHMEITGNQGKPAIAHRDLKSKNILVTSHLSACIADFGLAVKYTASTRSLDIPYNLRVGTRRYMAPELLDGSFHASSFDSYIATDLYACGLVLWEILTRCHLHEEAPADPYALPYSNLVPQDPSDKDMLDVVCAHGERPIVPDRFGNHSPSCCPTHNRILNSLGRLVVELWDKEPPVRNSALHVKKTILTAQKQLRSLQAVPEGELCRLARVIDPPRHGEFAPAFRNSSSIASSAQPLLQSSSFNLSSGSSTGDDEEE